MRQDEAELTILITPGCRQATLSIEGPSVLFQQINLMPGLKWYCLKHVFKMELYIAVSFTY